MEKIREYKGIIILILVVLVGAFYWYEWRPTQIRKKCAESANNYAHNSAYWQDNYDKMYEFCQREYGIEK